MLHVRTPNGEALVSPRNGSPVVLLVVGFLGRWLSLGGFPLACGCFFFGWVAWCLGVLVLGFAFCWCGPFLLSRLAEMI